MNWTSPKFLNLALQKDTLRKIKRQTTNWEIIFASHLSDKILTSRIYKELLQFNDKTNNQDKTIKYTNKTNQQIRPTNK